MKNNRIRGKKQVPVPLSSLFSKLLPSDFRQKTATINQYQQFFNSQTSDAVYQMVQVMNVSEDSITLAVPSSALVNYLRLHSLEIRQQISDQFGRVLDLKIVAQPQSMTADGQKNALKPARHFSPSVCDQLKKSAASLDDDELRAALISLSQAIREDEPGKP